MTRQVLSRMVPKRPSTLGSVALAAFVVVLAIFGAANWAKHDALSLIGAVFDTAPALFWAMVFVMRVRRQIECVAEEKAYEAAKARAALLSQRAQLEADLFRPVSEWIAEAEANAEREWADA